MTSPAPSIPSGVRWLIATAIVVLGAAGAWTIFNAYQTAASKECLAQYRAARTATDTARVDALIPKGDGHAGPEAHSCGFIRHSARW